MIQSLIGEGYLKTPRVIGAFRAVDRADFVLAEYKNQAYEDHPLPIGFDQTISQPLTVAFMLELLDPLAGDKILDIGSGSGWQTALLAEIVGPEGRVAAVERIRELSEFAQENLGKYDYVKKGVVEFYCQDAAVEIPDGPYDKIIAAAASYKSIPDIWKKKLKVGGKIVAPIGGSVWLFVKKTDHEYEEKEFPGFLFVPLVSEKKIKLKIQPSKIHLKSKNFFIFLTAMTLLIIAFLTNEIYRPHTAFSGSRSVEIPAGFGSRQIADLLKKEGFIRSKWALVIYVSLTGRASLLKSGSYVFFSSSAIPSIAANLMRGGTNERVITIVEGWSSKDIAKYLEQENFFSAKDFLKLADGKNPIFNKDRFNFLMDKPEKSGLEGYFFPDTYRIFKNAKLEEAIVKMLENFGRKLNPDLRKEIARQKKTIFEIIIMASLVEKEVSSDEDRTLVAGVLWKRLDVGMGLQVDATITYLTGKKSSKVSRAETEIDSPYNTYKYRGLPPGPISNPSLSAIKAVVYPKESSYLYYLSTDEGKTVFSKTLEEHNLAKAKYLK